MSDTKISEARNLLAEAFGCDPEELLDGEVRAVRAVLALQSVRPQPAELAEQQGVKKEHWLDRMAAIEGRIEPSAREMEGMDEEQVGEVQGAAHVLVLREMRARLTDAGSPARTSALDAAIAALAARQPGAQEPVEMSPDFTDSARGAIAWVLWHHQGGSSPIGQPLRHALGMGSDQRLSQSQIEEAKRFALWAGATTNDFHRHKPAQGIDLGQLRSQVLGLTRRVEPISGQRFSYVQLDDVLALIDQRDAGLGVE